MRGLFVTGTGTGVGKTALSAALIAAMRAAGEPVRAHKPVVTGLDEQREPGGWPHDHVLLARVAGMTPEEVSPLRYGPAVSPHLAAALAGEAIDPNGLIARARADAQPAVVDGAAQPAVVDGGARSIRRRTTAESATTLVVEGVGGLLVPFADGFTVRDLAAALDLPVVIAARTGLGTINHTLLTLEAARAAGLDVRAVVLTPWPEWPDELERCNRATIARLGEVEVECLDRVAKPDGADLARAGGTLPWRRWVLA